MLLKQFAILDNSFDFADSQKSNYLNLYIHYGKFHYDIIAENQFENFLTSDYELFFDSNDQQFKIIFLYDILFEIVYQDFQTSTYDLFIDLNDQQFQVITTDFFNSQVFIKDFNNIVSYFYLGILQTDLRTQFPWKIFQYESGTHN